MSEMLSIPVVTTRKGILEITARVLKSSGCLAFLLLFLLAAVSTASAVTTVAVAVTPASPVAYAAPITIKATLTSPVVGTISFFYGTSSGTQTTALTDTGCASVSVTTSTSSVSCTTSSTVLPVLATYYFKSVFTPGTGSVINTPTTTAYVVKQATTTVTWATPAAITYPTALSSTQLNASTGSVTTTCVYTPALTVVPNAGTQTLSVTCTPTDTTDYTTPAASTVSLTVNKGTPTYSWSAPSAISYPTALSGAQLNASLTGLGGTVSSSCTYSPLSGTVLLASGTAQTLTAICTPSDLVNYNTPVATSATTTLTVNKGTSTVTWANPTAINYGTLLSATQLDASLNVPGGCTYASNPVGTQLAAGSQTLTANCTPTDAVNYTTPSATTATLVVNKTPLTVTASSTTVNLGATAPTITPIYTGFLNSDTQYTTEVAANTVTCSVGSYSTLGTGAPWTNTCSGGASTANYTYSYVTGQTKLGAATTTSLKIGLATSSTTAQTSEPAGTSMTLTAIVTGTGAAGTVNFTYVDPSTSRTVSIPQCGSVILNSAFAFCTTSALPVSTNLQLVATFTSQSTGTIFAASSNPTPLAYAVTQTTTATTVAVTHVSAGTTSSVVYGTSVTLTASVTGTAAAGTVTFTYGESPVTPIPGCIALPLTAGAGSLTCVTTALPVGTNELLNAYFSNSAGAFSTSSQATPTAFAVTGGTASTTLAVTAVSVGTNNSLTSVVYGSSVTMAATVTTGAIGTVTFTYGSSTPITGCIAVPLSAGTASCVTTALPVASNEGLVAVFTASASSGYASSNSTATAFAVVVNPPTILLSAPTSSNFGGSVALAVTGLPVGAGAVGDGDTLTFFYGTSATTATTPVTCTNVVTISGSGTATCNTIMLPVATSFLAATFTPGTAMTVNIGAGPFSNATKPSIIVSKGSPSVALTTPFGTTYVGASVLLTATITPSSAMDTGTVGFLWGATSTPATVVTGCSAQSVTTSNGVTTATCTTTDITAIAKSTPGNYLKATYTPTTAANFNAIAAAQANLIVVGAVNTTTVVTVSGGPTYYYGVNPTLTATVSNTSAVGPVTFFNNGVLIGTGTTLSSGVSTLTPTTPLPVGTDLITATFTSNDTGISGYTNSTSLVVPITVSATPTTSVVYAITNANLAADLAGPTAASSSSFTATTASNADNSFVLYATIAPTAGTAVINGGHVSFYDVSSGGSVLLGTGTVTVASSLGTAYFKVNCAVASVTCSGPLSLGTRYLTATYGGVYGGTGTAQFAGSVSDTVPVIVNGTPTLTITASSPSVVFGAAAPVITPVYTISGGGPVAADWATCSATTAVDSNGISVYSCTSMPSFIGTGNRSPVCSTSTSPLFGPTTPVSTTGNASNAVYVTTCSGAKNGNYTIVNAPGVVTVTGKAPTWSNFNAVEVPYSTPVTLGATTNSGGAITYAMSKSNGCALQTDGTYKDVSSAPCTLTPISGTTFSATTWPGTYYVTATVAEDDTHNYAKASTQRSVIVIPATPVVNWSEPKAIAYGALLSTSAFPTCSATYKNPSTLLSKTVTGTCAWASTTQGAATAPGANTPSVGSFQTAIFTPSAAYGNGTVNGYNSVVTSLVANVTPIAATITTQPTATAIANGAAVYANGANVSKITPGVAKTGVGGTVLAGTWSWTCSLNGNTCTPITVFAATVYVTFTPSSANYTAVSTSVSITSLTATNVTVWPTASALTYGQTLSNSTLTTGAVVVDGQVAGTFGGKFTWAVPSAVPTVVGSPDKECLIYTPGGSDTGTAPTYSTNGGHGTSCADTPGTGVVSVAVTAGTPTVNWSAVPAETTYSGLALSTATFSSTDTDADPYTGDVAGLFSWDSVSASSIFPLTGTSTYLADFNATDTTDYGVTKGQVSITVNPCGLQDSKNSVYAVADFVDTDITGGTNQFTNASFPMTLSGVSNESVFCAVNSGPTITTVTPTVATPQITLTSANTIPADATINGTNSAVLAYGTTAVATKGATITITDGGLTSHASNGVAGSITTTGNYTSGVFASMGGNVDITNASINTSGTYSPALAATNQGTLAIYNVTAATGGDNSSAITTGVGGGQVTVAGGSYSNNDSTGGTTIATAVYAGGSCTNSDGTACTNTTISGQSHPWSTVTVGDGVNNGTTIGSTISAINGPAVVVEGGNTVSITSAGLTSLTGAAGNNQGILLYQSGLLTDATPATTTHPTTFSMTGGSLTYNCDANGDPKCGGTGVAVASDQNLLSTIFSVTNTTAAITLNDVTVYNNTNLATGADGILLTAAHLSTGPATVNFTLEGETVTGDVIVDKASTVNMVLAPDSTPVGTTWTGTIANTTYFDNQASGTTTLGTVNLTLDNTSTWIINAASVTLNSLTESTDNNIVYANVLCASGHPGCTVNITTPTNSGPLTFSPKTSSN